MLLIMDCPPTVQEYEGTPDERRDLVINDNLNRRHLTSEQKTKLIRYFLKQDPEQSDAQLSKKTGADRKTIRKTRQELEQGEEIPTLGVRTGADGKKYKQKKSARKPHRPAGPLVSSVKAQIRQYLSSQKDPKQAAQDMIEFIRDTLKALK